MKNGITTLYIRFVNIPESERVPKSRRDYNSSRALATALEAAAEILLALASARTSLPGLKLPDIMDLKARSKRAPKYHATPSWEVVSNYMR